MVMRETSIQSAIIPRPVVAALAAVVIVLIVAALVLWLYYGSAVFYEIIAAGIAMCL